MEPLRTVAELCAANKLTPAQLAEKALLDERRALAIIQGHWTPSPAERERVAAVFGLRKDEVEWGHTTSVQHLYGHGPQFGRTP